MTELLAPVGNPESLKVAIACGANAVYLGLDRFNARIKAENFTRENIKEYIDFCHLFGVKVYIAFNTCIKNSELPLLEEYVDACANAKADAFIVTDLGALDIYRKHNIPLHASTQLGVHNLNGAKFLEQLGFSRVVLSREALEEDILQIKLMTKLQIEYFVHGALCVSFSGGCLMSSMMSGDSGNRGMCNQPCRLPYASSYNNAPKYLLSPKDQCLITKIDKLISLGVSSLKIEGRLKQPHYVGEVLTQYRYALDRKKVTADGLSLLKRAYNRGNFTLGYNYEQTKDIMFTGIQGHMGEKIGVVNKVMPGFMDIETMIDLPQGSGVKIIKDNKELGGFEIRRSKRKGKCLSVACNKNYPVGSEVYLTLDLYQVEKYSNLNPKLPLDIVFEANLGKKLSLTFKYLHHTIKLVGDVVQPATNTPVTTEKMYDQINRLGETNFAINTLNVLCDEKGFVALSSINNMRKQALSDLKKVLLDEYNSKINLPIITSENMQVIENDSKKYDRSKMFVEIDSLEQLSPYLCKNANIVIDFSIFESNSVESILKNDLIENTCNNNLFVKLPKICRGKDKSIVEMAMQALSKTFVGVIAENVYAIQMARQFNMIVIGGVGLNIYNNKYAVTTGLNDYLPSLELALKEIKGLKTNLAYGYGKIAVMTLCHCPIQLNTRCTCGNCKYNGDFYYYDRHAKYTVKRSKLNYCYFTLYNPQTLDIRSRIDKFNSIFYLNMLECNKNQIKEIMTEFAERKVAENSDTNCENDKNITNGHYFRGVK